MRKVKNPERAKKLGRAGVLGAVWAVQLAVILLLAGAGDSPTAPIRVVAHRAGAAAAPENTLAALERAIAAGAEMAEVDVRLTRDGVLVAIHDSGLSRTAGLDREVSDTDWEIIRRLDAGSWYAGAFAGEKVPTLAQLLEAARGRIRLMIEMKPSAGDEGLAEKTVALIRQAGMEGQCILACTDLELLRRGRGLAPGLETVYIGDGLSQALCGLDYVDGVSLQSAGVTGESVEQARAAGKDIYVWTVNTTREIHRVLALGVDGVVTDDPALALKLRAEAERK